MDGGLVICRPARVSYATGDTFGFRLMSDLHIGARGLRLQLIEKELQKAAKAGDRILINGDVFDAILPGDRKRFSPDALHPRIAGRRDILNAAIDWAFEILAPYVDLIDMIGVGNHDTAVEKHHSVDPVLLLVDRLQGQCKEGHTIFYGGYTGFLDYRFRRNRRRESKDNRGSGNQRFVIYYHHGSGGAAPVTKGMIDFARKQWVQADVIWMGHKHNRWNGEVYSMRCPLSGDEPILRDVRHIMTGSYFKTYHGQTQQSIRENGRRSSYAADAGMAPQGMGSARIVLEMSSDTYEVEVTQ